MTDPMEPSEPAEPRKRASPSDVLVPQSTSLESIKAIMLAAIESSDSSVEVLTKVTGFQPRRVHYARTAARALGLIDSRGKATTRAYRLINAADEGEEARLWTAAIAESTHLRRYAKGLIDPGLGREQLTANIVALTGFSADTAGERAGTLLSWKQAIADMAATQDTRQLFLPIVDEGGGRAESIPRTIPQLKLPKRYEILENEARAHDIDVSSIVQRVDTAAERVETLMRQVLEGGSGRFEVFFGQTGSGKTTFLRTLPKFFAGARVHIIGKAVAHGAIADFIRRNEEVAGDGEIGIYVIDERDNDKIGEEQAEELFEDMRLLFRSPLGRVLVIWPVTRQRTAELLTAVAWATGGDSIVAMDTRGCYGFVGVPKSQYYAIADLTVQSLAGEPLDAFAIAEDEARRFLPDATTISQYFTLVEQEASKRRRATWEVLRKKVTPRVWIILTGDDERRLEETTALLSQGLNAQIDVQRVLNMLDDRKRDANYLKEWRRRRSEAAYLMRTLDVRILPLPPNAAVAAVRAYGSDKLKAALQKQTISADACIQTIMRTRLYKQIVRELGGDPDPHTKGKPVGEKTAQEYKRVQQNASVDDKPLNYALGRALEAALFANGHRVRVMVEKRRLVEGVTLQPDIQVWIGDAEVICLEPTWRTAGGELEGELEKRQSSIGMGAIQRYALGKIHEYVKALEL